MTPRLQFSTPFSRLREAGADLKRKVGASLAIFRVHWTQQAMRTFSAYIEWDPESKLYVGIVPGLPGAHTQAASLDELRKNLAEVLELCLEEYKGSADDLPHFVGVQQIEVPL